MAQLVEHIVHIDGVIGSSPIGTTKEKDHPLWMVFFFGNFDIIRASDVPVMNVHHRNTETNASALL